MGQTTGFAAGPWIARQPPKPLKVALTDHQAGRSLL